MIGSATADAPPVGGDLASGKKGENVAAMRREVDGHCPSLRGQRVRRRRARVNSATTIHSLRVRGARLWIAQRPGRSSRLASPAAMLTPTWPCTLSGCSAIVLFEPPTSDVAADADAERRAALRAGIIAGEIAGPEPRHRRIHAPGQRRFLGDAEIETDLADGRDVAVFRRRRRRAARNRDWSRNRPQNRCWRRRGIPGCRPARAGIGCCALAAATDATSRVMAVPARTRKRRMKKSPADKCDASRDEKRAVPCGAWRLYATTVAAVPELTVRHSGALRANDQQ